MSQESPPTALQSGSTQRLEALADGVFSIVLTLLVFEIMPPKDKPADDLGKLLLGLWPSFLAYGISVGLVGIYWSAHRSQFRVITQTDHALNWLNLLFLAVVSLLPFSTRLIASYPTERIALAVYGANLATIGVALYAVWHHATREHRLIDPATPDSLICYGETRCLLGTCGYMLGTLLAFISPPAALAVFAAVPLPYILPPLHRAWLARYGLTGS